MSFSKDLARFTVKAEKATDETRKAICMELFASVILDTPVDTGRARGNWQASTGTPKTDEIDRTDPQGAQAIAEAQGNLGKLGDTVFLANNLAYIERLEYGWSLQSPGGMVRRNVARVQSIVDKAARENKV